MIHKSICCSLVLAAAMSLSPAYATTPGDLLFKGVSQAHELAAEDREAIATLLPITVRGPLLVDLECKAPSNPSVVLRDLNGDGHSEVIVIEGNSCAYGMVGRSTHLLTNEGGKWRILFSAQGEGFQIRPATSGDWPILMPPVPGFCYPIYGYSDIKKHYVLIGRTPDPKMPNACVN